MLGADVDLWLATIRNTADRQRVLGVQDDRKENLLLLLFMIQNLKSHHLIGFAHVRHDTRVANVLVPKIIPHFQNLRTLLSDLLSQKRRVLQVLRLGLVLLADDLEFVLIIVYLVNDQSFL